MLIPAEYAQLNWKFGGVGAPTGAEFTCGVNVELYAGSPADAATDAFTVWFNTFRTLQSSAVVLEEVLCKFGPNSTGPSGVASGGQAGAGSATQEAPNTAVLIQKVTGFGGRTGRGRMYVPGPIEATFSSAGLMNSTTAGNWQTVADAFRSQLIAAGLVPVLLHAPTSPVVVPMPITEMRVSSLAATQRQRLRR